jgi:AraC family transcriptional regulator, transcriptional activator of pobA
MVESAELALDTLRGGALLTVDVLAGLDVGEERPPRSPHRHDYHELIWIRAGGGEQVLDGEAVPVRPGTVTVVGRGQVHVFRRAAAVQGAVLRFADELLLGAGGRIAGGWLVAGRGGLTIAVPPGDRPALAAQFDALAAEARRPPDPYAADVQRHLLATVLLWLERWYDGGRAERRDAADADVQLHRRFAARLEKDFAAHHDAAHYADALAVPPAALARALVRLTGRSTKELVLDRVMLEAARLLRFTDLGVGEVAHRVGFDDPLYFSRAFKRRHGQAPLAYRATARGED